MKIANFIGNDKTRFAKLFALYIKNEKIVSQRAAYTVGHCFDAQQQLITPYIPALIKILSTSNQHEALIRCSVRILQEVEIPEDLQGRTIEDCYKLLRSPKEAIAIRAFSIGVIYNITNLYPELKQELLLTLQDLLNHESPGIRGRSNKIYNLLKKEMNRSL